MSLTPSFRFIWLWAWELGWSQCLWGLWGGHHFVFLEILVLQQGCSSKGQIWALSLCMLWQMHMALGVSQLFILPVFCWLCCIAFWCHPSSCCEDKRIEWRLLYVNHSLVVLNLLLFFMLLVYLCQGLPRIRLWGRMCDPYVNESFLTAIPQSSRRDSQPCIVRSVDFSFKVIFIDW